MSDHTEQGGMSEFDDLDEDETLEERDQTAAVMYQQGATCAEIASVYGLTREGVRQALIRCGVPRRSKGQRRKPRGHCTAAGDGWSCDRLARSSKGLCAAHYQQRRAGRQLAEIRAKAV